MDVILALLALDSALQSGPVRREGLRHDVVLVEVESRAEAVSRGVV